jgi:hypothetical protein
LFRMSPGNKPDRICTAGQKPGFGAAGWSGKPRLYKEMIEWRTFPAPHRFMRLPPQGRCDQHFDRRLGVTAVPASGLNRSQQAVVRLFREGACIRVPREDRLAEGSDRYKKGWEIRLYVSQLGVERARTVLKRAGIEPGRAYHKSPNRWIVPVYGRDQVETVLSWAQASNPPSD